MTDQMIMAALAGITEANPQWQALLEILSRQITIEADALMQPHLTNEGAQFNRGRWAALVDYKTVLQQALHAAQVVA